MALTTSGLKYIAQAITGQITPFDAANAHLGVGNGTMVFNMSNTDLRGTETLRKGMDAGYPVVEPPTLSFKSTFGPDEANFSWNEWGVFNAATGGVMLNRVVESNGTKQANQTWVLEVAITFDTGN